MNSRRVEPGPVGWEWSILKRKCIWQICLEIRALHLQPLVFLCAYARGGDILHHLLCFKLNDILPSSILCRHVFEDSVANVSAANRRCCFFQHSDFMSKYKRNLIFLWQNFNLIAASFLTWYVTASCNCSQYINRLPFVWLYCLTMRLCWSVFSQTLNHLRVTWNSYYIHSPTIPHVILMLKFWKQKFVVIEDYGSLVYFAVTVVVEHFLKCQVLHN